MSDGMEFLEENRASGVEGLCLKNGVCSWPRLGGKSGVRVFWESAANADGTSYRSSSMALSALHPMTGIGRNIAQLRPDHIQLGRRFHTVLADFGRSGSCASDYLDWSQAYAVRLPKLKASTKMISLRLPVALLERIRLEANKRDMPYRSLIKAWLAEDVDQHRQ
jgi:hypothetical protein